MKKVYYVSIEEDGATGISGLVKRLRSFGYTFETIASVEEVKAIDKPEAKIVLCTVDLENEEHASIDICQAFKDRFPHLEVIAAFSGKLEYDQQTLFDADIDAVFQYPFEDELLINHFFDTDPVALENHQLSFDILARVSVMELKAGDKLPFALYIYLPANQKIIPYNHENQALDDVVLEKFKKNAHYNLYIKKMDLKIYYDYCAKFLKEKKETLSAEQYHREVNTQLRGLMGDFFHKGGEAKEQAQMLENLGKIVSQLEDESGSKIDLVNEVNKIAARQLTNYTHAKNMATYCALFGMMAGIHEPESLRIGGLLHDLGMMDLPLSLLHKDISEMNELELAQFKLHPGNAKLSLQTKGTHLPKSVENMIMQHHENPDGSGFPYGLKINEIDPMAKVCAFADAFDTLTSVREGYKQYTPRDAMLKIAGIGEEAPMAFFDEEFHGPIVSAFMDGEFVVGSVTYDEKPAELGEVEKLQMPMESKLGQADSNNQELEDHGGVSHKSDKQDYGSVKSNNPNPSLQEEEKLGYVLSQLVDEEDDEVNTEELSSEDESSSQENNKTLGSVKFDDDSKTVGSTKKKKPA